MVETIYCETDKLKDIVIFNRYYQLLSQTRKNKTDQLRMGEDKRHSVGAGILLEYMLSKYGMRENTAEIAYKENGKPYFPEYPQLQFNLSHSHGIVICSYSDKEVGCDIEKRSSAREPVARRFFTSQEYASIFEKTTEEEQKKQFYRIWTMKESFIKITGRGMALELNEFQVPLKKNEHIYQQKYYDCPVYVKEYDLGDYEIAVCAMSDLFAEKLVKINLTGILH